MPDRDPDTQPAGGAVVVNTALDVMTFNLRLPVEGHPSGHPDHWRDRLPATTVLLRERRPHLVGTQEGVWAQLRPLLEDLPHYGLVGTGRDGGSRGEYSAILYDRARLTLEGWGQWWLSPTPTVIGSVGWGASCTRIATLAAFTDRATGQPFTVVNTHLDHVSEEARTRGAESIAVRLPTRGALVTGDFNSPAGVAPAWRVLTDAGLVDTWDVAEQRSGEGISTVHGYTEPGVHHDHARVPRHHLPDSLGPAVRIDWVLASPDWRVLRVEVVTDRPGGVWPSDHWPVAATLDRSS